MKVMKAAGAGFDEALRLAMQVIDAGGVVAYPTETFYALGVRFDDDEALERIYALKGRDPSKPTALIVPSDLVAMGLATHVNDLALCLMERYWPGPLTLLLNAREGLHGFIVEDGKVAVRVPGESFALQLVRAVGYPITSTSANLSGHEPSTTAEEVCNYFADSGCIDLLIDGGRTPGGLPSTFVDASGTGIKILRSGVCVIDSMDLRC